MLYEYAHLTNEHRDPLLVPYIYQRQVEQKRMLLLPAHASVWLADYL